MFYLGIGRDRLQNIAKHWHKTGTPRPELRGGYRKSDQFQPLKHAIRQHIESFTCRASHYARRGAPGRKYLPADLNVRKMHQLFSEQNDQQVTYGLYYSVFNSDYNLGFGSPSKDICSTCARHRLRMQDPEASAEEKEEEARLLLCHQQTAHQFFRAMNRVGNSFTICFDVMENLVLPKTSVGEAFYARQLYLYVFGVVVHHGEGSSQTKEDVNFFTWLESENRKDSNMIASALYYFLTNIATQEILEKQHLRLFSDSCYGQNKNIGVVSMLFKLKSSIFNQVQIEHYFPIRGHTFYQLIEHLGALRKTFEDKTQFCSLQNARKSCNVMVLCTSIKRNGRF